MARWCCSRLGCFALSVSAVGPGSFISHRVSLWKLHFSCLLTQVLSYIGVEPNSVPLLYSETLDAVCFRQYVQAVVVYVSASGSHFSFWRDMVATDRKYVRSLFLQITIRPGHTHTQTSKCGPLFLNARPFVRFIATARPKAGRYYRIRVEVYSFFFLKLLNCWSWRSSHLGAFIG